MTEVVWRKRQPVAERLHFARAYVPGFQTWLLEQSYSPNTIEELVRLLAIWTQWVHEQGYTLATIVDGYRASKPIFLAQPKKIRRALSPARSFIEYLQVRGIIREFPSPQTPVEKWPVLKDFRTWAQTHRGTANSTLDNYQWKIVQLLTALGDNPSAYTAKTIRNFLLEATAPHSRAYAISTAVAVRAFLRYLTAIGQVSPELRYAVPTFANWKLETVPRHLKERDVDRVIAACSPEERSRDRAIVLLLARLALRAGEVARLQIRDIDWRNSRLLVSGKNRRTDRLPLTQEVGDAILHYLERERPRSTDPHIFLKYTAPLGPITRITVKCVVDSALDRAGVKSQVRGAHILRHSAATNMLKDGMTLAGVGAVLRHKSPTTTAIYAKTDFNLLGEVTRPWIGRLPC